MASPGAPNSPRQRRFQESLNRNDELSDDPSIPLAAQNMEKRRDSSHSTHKYDPAMDETSEHIQALGPHVKRLTTWEQRSQKLLAIENRHRRHWYP
jgi:hypothetical protein